MIVSAHRRVQLQLAFRCEQNRSDLVRQITEAKDIAELHQLEQQIDQTCKGGKACKNFKQRLDAAAEYIRDMQGFGELVWDC